MEFPLPKELKGSEIRVTYFGIEKDSFVVEYLDKDKKTKQRIHSLITRYKEPDKDTLCTLFESKLAFVFDNSAIDYVIAKLGDAIDKLYTSDTQAIKVIQKIKKKAEAEAEGRDAEDESKLKKVCIQKYFDKSRNVLYEAILVAGKPYFVFQEPPTSMDDVEEGEQIVIRLVNRILLPDTSNPTTELLPPEKDQYQSKTFEFDSEQEIKKYFKLAAATTFDSLYKRQKKIASKYIDASDTQLTILAADSIFTYFQDKLGQTHYLMFIGDNDTGKTQNLRFLQQTGYRAKLEVDTTAANIYGFLGNFEEGQGIILEDEVDDLDKTPEKMKIYKAGYNAGEKVTRTDITGYGRKTQSWNTFCFKAFTAEKAPDTNTAKGFLDRTFIFHCIRGEPDYDIAEITNPAGDKQHEELLKELEESHKMLFAFRLLHYHDPLPNIELSVKNREKQLCKPLLRLFQNSEFKEEIGIALADMIGQKRGLKRDTLEAKILDVVCRIIEQNQKMQERRNVIDNGQFLITKWQPNQIQSSDLIAQVAKELGGTYRRPEEDKSFETEEHGTVSHTAISRICVDKFGAEAKRTNSTRYLEFNLAKLDKAKSAYIFPDKVEIVAKSQNKTVDRFDDATDDAEDETMGKERPSGAGDEEETEDLSMNEHENGPENRMDNTEKSRVGSDEYLQLEGVGGRPNEDSVVKYEIGAGPAEHASIMRPGYDENSLYTFKEENTSHSSPQDTEELFQLINGNEQINPFAEVIKKAIRYRREQNPNNNDDGYFSKEDYVYIQLMQPNERWTVDQAEQTLYALIENGVVEEIE